jgi:hypothetical protein
MRRSLAKFSESEANHTPSLADFTTTTPELKFSVHTGTGLPSFKRCRSEKSSNGPKLIEFSRIALSSDVVTIQRRAVSAIVRQDRRADRDIRSRKRKMKGGPEVRIIGRPDLAVMSFDD